MADEGDAGRRSREGQAGSGAAWPALGAASRTKADASFDEQIAVPRLQKQRLLREEVALDEEQCRDLSRLRLDQSASDGTALRRATGAQHG